MPCLSHFIEGSLNSKLPTIWRVENKMKSRWDEVKSEERRCNCAKVRRKKIHPRQMLEKSRNAVFFQWFVCRVSRKVGSLKRRVRSHVSEEKWKIARRCGEKHIFKWKCAKHVSFGPLFEVEMLKNCTPLWREAHFQAKMYKTCQVRTIFWSWDVEKLHAAVARRTLKMCKTCQVGPLFEVEMSKNCTPLWREAHFQVKMLKNWRSRSTFWSSDVEKLHAAVARSAFVSQNVQNTCVLPHFLKFRCRKICQFVN